MMGDTVPPVPDLNGLGHATAAPAPGMSLLDVAVVLSERLKTVLLLPLIIGVVTFGLVSLEAPIFTASTTFLPPLQAQSSAGSVLASLGALTGVGGGATRSSADQYIALMQSFTVSDRIIDRFKLMQLNDIKFRTDARKSLAGSVRFAVGKKDGLITVEVDDKDPKLAADMANRYVDELRTMTNTIAIGEAQQRRVFFEQQLSDTRDRLAKAQIALQGSGVSEAALKTEPRSAAEGFATLKAETTAAEVRLQSMKRGLSDSSPEVLQQEATLGALRSQLSKLEQSTDVRGGSDYITKYREFKYQETLFDLYARQFEAARADESREGAMIQVVDPATPPERKSKPKRSVIALEATVASALLLSAWVLLRQAVRQSSEDPETAGRLRRLRRAFAFRKR